MSSLLLTKHFKHTVADGRNSPGLFRGRADIGLEDIPDRTGVTAGEAKTNPACKSDMEQWPDHPRYLARDGIHPVSVILAWCKVDQLFTTRQDLGGGNPAGTLMGITYYDHELIKSKRK